jgi:hypothetical protein
MGYEKEAGVTSPAGFFDPLGLSANIDKDTFDYYRSSELKHGRVAQLAVLGYVVPEIYKFPGEIAPGITFASIPNGVAAIEAVPSLGWMQIFFFIGYIDYRLTMGKSAVPFAWQYDKEVDSKAYDQELNHGRLAMLASLELLRHDSQNFVSGVNDVLITGLPFLYGK